MKAKLICILLLALAVFASAEMVDRIVATVGSEIILMSDLEKQINQMRSTGVREELLVPAEVLDNMVAHRIMIQKAKELNITIDETALRNYAERYMGQIKSQFPTEADFQAELRKMNTTQRELMDYFVEQLKENALSEQLVEKQISSRVRIEESELLAFYEASKDSMAVKPVAWDLRMILREIKASDESEAALLAEAEELRRRADNGEDFAQLATESSDCPSKQQGGDLGFFKRGMMVKPFEDAAFALSIGEISQVVKTQFGYHIIKVTDRKGEEVRASHILKMIEAGENDEEREMALMNSIRERILAGESFADLATQYSSDAETAAEGGLLGEFAERDFPELFSAALMATPVGSPTEVLKNEGMIYLFVRDTEHPERLFTFEEVREQVMGYLKQKKQIEAYAEWISKVKAESYIKISL
ncbi:MAG: peptidylprolyl isomerase [Candidatus Cloacimonetes bacterium]|jgi:parvulin-like peptidyl-prolyl isomerase|nr:peptidylprolyl isomerase [Candidatus Cloacimonadota bacterium]MDD2543770.1 peptidylprolyl isomerase [Candidatus Cloacimonadota bacterium]MDD2682707.1 peptidylprolyl isomerase [Candidatus Cloacimonadota bacterium]MDD4667449.1 peptidylprolyl isomerase [Candidatus Cloacimonadota bacterium]MDY0337305.1 peptidylprolyl isomerase [Candidatus Cloacimonadaceae bacterium]